MADLKGFIKGKLSKIRGDIEKALKDLDESEEITFKVILAPLTVCENTVLDDNLHFEVRCKKEDLLLEVEKKKRENSMSPSLMTIFFIYNDLEIEITEDIWKSSRSK